MSDADDLPISDRLVIPGNELRWRFSRSSGPGGQSVNTSDSRVELGFDVARSAALPSWLRARALARLGPRLVDGVLTVAAQDERSQLANRNLARKRLASILAGATTPPPAARRPTRPSRGAVERRLEAKKARSVVKRMCSRPQD